MITGAGKTTAAQAGAAAKKNGRSGDIRDIRRVMILMQENRRFGHYFGTMRGVIGFGGEAAITLPGGCSVFQQPVSEPGQAVTGTRYPWWLANGAFSGPQPPDAERGAQDYGGTPHSWETQHKACNGGQLNSWYRANGGPATPGFLARNDIPFQDALAGACTAGDAYHCPALSAAGPNRTCLRGGTINAGQEHGSCVACDGGGEPGKFLPWQSYPAALQNAGVTWKIYQGPGSYGDNGAQYYNEKWTAAIGTPAICLGISQRRRAVSGDLTNALDFTHPVSGLPDLPFITVPTGEPATCHPIPPHNALPAQEPGARPARPLPYQANAALTGFTNNSDGTVSASLALSDNAPHVSTSGHFWVHNNLGVSQTLTNHPDVDLFPRQYTVAGSKKLTAATPATLSLGAPGACDITVVSASRFLRRFTGDVTKAGTAAQVTAVCCEGGFDARPALVLKLASHGKPDVTFTITHDQYSTEGPKSCKVRAGRSEKILIGPLASSRGRYDLTITIDSDKTWSQRYTGHLETGGPGITGAV
jgi:hypothetical protein